ncbi:MAG: L-2-amino-thiazoline-4-carboxylic acid hydrolase [Paracoccaceae bacterium]
MSTPEIKPDTLTQTIGVLMRREVEARILVPVVAALADAFGREAVVDILRDTIEQIARDQGADLAAQYGTDAAAFKETLEFWTRDGALELETLRDDGRHLDFNVTRCRYAEMYRALGVPELGAVLSCNRDAALIEGFNPKAGLTRDQTIMQGAPCCTFRYDFRVESRD